MICPFCGRTFDAEAAQAACRTCTMLGGCKKVKCPHCSYEMPAETSLVKWLRKKLGKGHGQS